MSTRRNKSRRPANPSAAPKLTPMQRALLEEAGRKVTIVVDGQQVEMRVGKVLTRKLFHSAIGGSSHSLSNAYNEMVLAEQLQEAEIEASVAFGHRYKVHQQELLDRALKDGLDPDTVLPHPDDICVVKGDGCRIVGPENDNDLNLIKANCARRDVLILQHVLEERLRPSGASRHPNDLDEEDDHSSALLLVYILNKDLPERFRMSDADIHFVIMRHERKTKRELLKGTHRAWAAIGRPKPRGWTLPPFPRMRAKLEHAMPAFVELYQQVASGKLVSEHVIADRIRDIVRRQSW